MLRGLRIAETSTAFVGQPLGMGGSRKLEACKTSLPLSSLRPSATRRSEGQSAIDQPRDTEDRGSPVQKDVVIFPSRLGSFGAAKDGTVAREEKLVKVADRLASRARSLELKGRSLELKAKSLEAKGSKRRAMWLQWLATTFDGMAAIASLASWGAALVAICLLDISLPVFLNLTLLVMGTVICMAGGLAVGASAAVGLLAVIQQVQNAKSNIPASDKDMFWS
ncbi:hypothetical protein GUITHDRAFT_155426, partial [Guillardia theta CCMP2712]